MSKSAENVKDSEPRRIRLLTWNIDGLDTDDLVSRTKAVCAVIQREMPHLVLLQEVVPESLVILQNECPQFRIIPAGNEGYFTAIMMHDLYVVYESHEIFQFYSSVMLRNRLTIKLLVKGMKCHIITSHLESTKAHAEERMKQLRCCLKALTDGPEDTTMLFAGDLNIRDYEIRAIGGLPENVLDMWEVTGKRTEDEFTWDTTENDNLGMDARAKCRFDRVYMRRNNPPQLRAVHFELVGLERLTSCQRFPSDHWGILVHYDKIPKSQTAKMRWLVLESPAII